MYFTLPPYNFRPSCIGLLNLAPFIKGTIGSIFASLFGDRSIICLAKRNNGYFEPEMRLWTAVPAILIMPFSLLWFGLATAYSDAWIIPAVGLAFFGFGFALLGDVGLTYAMDCYNNVCLSIMPLHPSSYANLLIDHRRCFHWDCVRPERLCYYYYYYDHSVDHRHRVGQCIHYEHGPCFRTINADSADDDMGEENEGPNQRSICSLHCEAVCVQEGLKEIWKVRFAVLCRSTTTLGAPG